jgi:hypothetical protein
VIGRASAAEIVVVHSRQVVVDQAERVDHLERRGRGERQRAPPRDRLAGKEAERGTKALPSGDTLRRIARWSVQALEADGRVARARRLDLRRTRSDSAQTGAIATRLRLPSSPSSGLVSVGRTVRGERLDALLGPVEDLRCALQDHSLLELADRFASVSCPSSAVDQALEPAIICSRWSRRPRRRSGSLRCHGAPPSGVSRVSVRPS